MSQLLKKFVVKFTADASSFSRGLRQMESSLRATGKKVSALGKKMTILGGAVTALGVAFAATAIKGAMKFNKAMIEVSTIAGDNKRQIEKWREQIVDLGLTYGKSTTQITNALYQLLSSGVAANEALAMLETTIKASEVGFVDQALIVKATTSIINAYSMSTGEALRINDVFFEAVRQGMFRMNDLASSIGNVIPLSKALGVSYKEVLALIATMTKSGMSTERAMTSVRAALNQILNASEDQIVAGDNLGVVLGHTALKAQGLAGWFNHLRSSTDGNIDSLRLLFKNVRAINAVLTATGETSEEFNRILNDLEGSIGTVDKQFEKIEESSFKQVEIATASLKIAWDEVGDAVLVVTADFLKANKETTDSIISWIRTNKEAIAGYVLATIKIGALVLGIGTMTYAIGKSLTMLSQFAKGVIISIPYIAATTTQLILLTKATAAYAVQLGKNLMQVLTSPIKFSAMSSSFSAMAAIMGRSIKFLAANFMKMAGAIKNVIVKMASLRAADIAGGFKKIGTYLKVASTAALGLMTHIKNLPALLAKAAKSAAALKTGIFAMNAGLAAGVGTASYFGSKWVFEVTGVTEALGKFFHYVSNGFKSLEDEAKEFGSDGASREIVIFDPGSLEKQKYVLRDWFAEQSPEFIIRSSWDEEQARHSLAVLKGMTQEAIDEIIEDWKAADRTIGENSYAESEKSRKKKEAAHADFMKSIAEQIKRLEKKSIEESKKSLGKRISLWKREERLRKQGLQNTDDWLEIQWEQRSEAIRRKLKEQYDLEEAAFKDSASLMQDLSVIYKKRVDAELKILEETLMKEYILRKKAGEDEIAIKEALAAKETAILKAMQDKMSNDLYQAMNERLGKIKEYYQKQKQLELELQAVKDKRLQSAESIAEARRNVARQSMTEEQKWYDDKAEADRLMRESRISLINGDLEAAEAFAKRAQTLYAGLARVVKDSEGNITMTLDQTSDAALVGLDQVEAMLELIFNAMERVIAEAMDNAIKKIEELKHEVEALLQAAREETQVNLKTDDARKELQSLIDAMDELEMNFSLQVKKLSDSEKKRKEGQKHAFGGVVSGPAGIDNVPAMLSPGEFVVRADVANSNRGLLDALNKGAFPSQQSTSNTDSSNTSIIINVSEKLTPEFVRKTLIPQIRRLREREQARL